MVIVVINGSKDLCFYMLFTFFHFILEDSLSYSFLFQNIYFIDTTSSINNIFIKNITGNILLFLISNLLFPLQRYCLDFTADFTKIQTYLYKALMILLYSTYHATNYNFISNNVKEIQASKSD